MVRPLTAQDAAFSLNVLKDKGHPQITKQQLRDMNRAPKRLMMQRWSSPHCPKARSRRSVVCRVSADLLESLF